MVRFLSFLASGVAAAVTAEAFPLFVFFFSSSSCQEGFAECFTTNVFFKHN